MPGRAEDLLQTVLARAWRRWGRIGSAHPEAYVRRMLYHMYVTWWRRRWNAETPTEALPDSAGGTDPAVSVAERDAVVRALAELSRHQRAILVLRYLEDLSVSETARLLGCSESTVTTQTSRALTAMRATPHLQQMASKGARS
jgi:RNA polymerase sigma-70 factor (sigma-E family)